jgi:hypothetical protein
MRRGGAGGARRTGAPNARLRPPRTTAAILVVCLAAARPGAAQEAASRPSDVDPALAAYADRVPAVVHYGVYAGADKVGSTAVRRRVGDVDGQPAFFVSRGFELHGSGDAPLVRVESALAFSLRGDGALLYADIADTRRGRTDVSAVRRAGDGYAATFRTDATVVTRAFAEVRDSLRGRAAFDAFVRSPRSPGEEFSFVSLEARRGFAEIASTAVAYGRRAIVRDGLHGHAAVFDIAAEGAMRRIAYEEGVPTAGPVDESIEAAPWTVRAEEPEQARDPDFAVDLQAPSFGVVDRPLGDPAAVRRLRLRVRGLDADLSSDGCQRSASSDGDRFVAVEPVASTEVPLLARDEASRRYARPRYRAAVVAATAARVVADAADAGEKIGRLTAWVHEHLAKTPFADAETAEEILRRGAGDASEHALLFAALALSVGVPAREVGGLRYGGDAYGRFHWHVWNEAFDGARWIAVDPTFGLAPADAARVRFTDAPEEPRWAATAARCRFEVIELETR